MARINTVEEQLNDALLSCSKRIRILLDDGFEKNKKAIRDVRRERAMYTSFLNRITQFKNRIYGNSN